MVSRVRDTVNIENTLISTGVPYLVRLQAWQQRKGQKSRQVLKYTMYFTVIVLVFTL